MRDHARDVGDQPHAPTELRHGPGSSAVDGHQRPGKVQLLLPEVREGGAGDLGIVDVLRCLSGQELARDPLNIVGRAQALRKCQVDFDEVRKFGEGIPGAQAVHAVGRQRDAVAARQPQNVAGWIERSRWTCNSTLGMARIMSSGSIVVEALKRDSTSAEGTSKLGIGC